MTTTSVKPQLIVLILLAGLVMGYNLGGSSLHNQDEAKHAVVAQEAATQGHWLSLTYKGRPYFSKPPLRIWLTALTFKAAGINEWTVRFWSAVFGLATVLALYLIGRRLYGERVAFLSSLILLTSHQYIYNHCVRTGETDSMLIFCWVCALLLLQLSVQEKSRRALYFAAVFLGLGGLVKHLGFVPIVALIGAGYVVLAGVWQTFSWKIWGVGLGIVGAIVLPWHLLQWAIEGRAFLEAYFLGEIVEKRLKATGGGPRIVGSGPWTSILTMSQGFFPWSCLLPFALGEVLGRKELRHRWLMPTLWLVAALIATVISGRKFTWYVLPAFPAAAILVAGFVDRFLKASSPALTRVSMVLGTLLALASTTDAAYHNPFEVMARRAMLTVHFLGRLRRPESSLLSAIALLLAITALTALTYAALGRLADPLNARGLARRLLVLAMVGLALYIVIVPLEFSRTISPIHEIARATQNHLADRETLYVSLPGRKTRDPRFYFYFGDKKLKHLEVSELATDRESGELLLTDLATLEQSRESTGQVPPLDHALARAKGLVLLRWPPG